MADPNAEVDQIESTVQRMAELHARHMDEQTSLQRHVSHATAWLSSPRAVPIAVVAVLGWVALNWAAPMLGRKAVDPAPFALLELIATVVALFTTLMILATQVREEEASRHRSQLTLQLASLSEQKIAKVIALLEEQRRESEHLPDRKDREAEEMARSADPAHVLARIKDTHEE